MIWNRLSTRRNALRFGLGAAASIGCSAFAKDVYRNDQIQSLDDPSRNFIAARPNRFLKEIAKGKKIIYGAASDYKMLSSDPKFAARFVQECGILAPENGLKWQALRPKPDQFDFDTADKLFTFAQTHKLQMRGHALVWHLSMPSWFKEVVTPQNAEEFFVNHIRTVAKRYAGKVHSWDVVNEAIEVADKRPDGLRKTPWLEFLGEDYIDLAFRVAAEADPNALLTYNDYGLEYDISYHDARRDAVLKLLERLKAKGTPIHAFGMQSHLLGHETKWNPGKVRNFLRDIASLGLKIFVTELDVTDRDLPADIAVRDRIVASAYEDYLSVVLDEPAVTTVLTWGLSDRYTWLSEFVPRQDKLPVRSLPMDTNLNRKLAWNAIARAFDKAQKR